jgi:hypothetical protein
MATRPLWWIALRSIVLLYRLQALSSSGQVQIVRETALEYDSHAAHLAVHYLRERQVA